MRSVWIPYQPTDSHRADLGIIAKNARHLLSGLKLVIFVFTIAMTKLHVYVGDFVSFFACRIHNCGCWAGDELQQRIIGSLVIGKLGFRVPDDPFINDMPRRVGWMVLELVVHFHPAAIEYRHGCNHLICERRKGPFCWCEWWWWWWDRSCHVTCFLVCQPLWLGRTGYLFVLFVLFAFCRYIGAAVQRAVCEIRQNRCNGHG